MHGIIHKSNLEDCVDFYKWRRHTGESSEARIYDDGGPLPVEVSFVEDKTGN